VTNLGSTGYVDKGRGTVKIFLLAVLAALLLSSMFAPPMAQPAQAQVQTPPQQGLKPAGPIDPSNGFPFWYQDKNDLRLDLCLDPQDQKCLQPFESPNPTGPVSFPDNFPGEAFWWTGEAQTTTNNGSDALLVLAMEAAFANDEVKNGDQMSFGRVRVRVDGLQIGQKYKVTHPYGVDTFVAEDDGKGAGEINSTEDIGCFPTPRTPCNFDQASSSRIGPFLTWDTFGGTNNDPALRGANGEPNAYVGDPNVEHAVKGSPYGTNVFKVERLNADGTVAQQVSQTNQFAVSGKVSNPATPDPQPQPPTAPTGLALDAASNSGDPADSVTNDTTPTINGTAQANVSVDILDGNQVVGTGTAGADGSFSITTSVLPEGHHPITAVAKNGTLSSAPSGSIALTIDTTAPAAPGANPPPGTYNSAQSVTLSTGDAADKIYYTTDGSDPTTGSTVYGSPIQVANTQTTKAIAVDTAGNQGAIGTFAYTIQLQAATQLSLSATPQSFAFGSAGSVAISGRLTSANAGVSGQQVIVEKRPAGAADWVRVGTAPTQANGSYSLNVARSTVDRNTDFRARFAGSTAQRLQASQSADLRVGVQAQVNLNNVANLRAGQTATLSGSVAPAKPGSIVTVTITGGGQTVTRQATLQANSTYNVTWQTPAARGVTYTAVARFAGDANHEAGQSASRTFRTN
jgi:hypothetical protein